MSNPSDDDDDTTFMEDPEKEERITGITIPLNTHNAEPTALSLSIDKPADLERFYGHELFDLSQDLASRILSQSIKEEPNHGGWKDILEAALTDAVHEALDSDDKVKEMKLVALRLSLTPPTIFGNAFAIKEAEKAAALSFQDFHGEVGKTRHDMVLWSSAFYLLGKNFDLDEWNNIEYENVGLEVELNPTDNVMKVKHGKDQSFFVTRAAEDAMIAAVNALSAQPTQFFRAKYSVVAVCKILDTDFLQYSIPQTTETRRAFDWDAVISDVAKTYPQPIVPSKDEFFKVMAVHMKVKEDKDTQARAIGMPKSTCPASSTFQQRWKLWREVMIVYATMEPDMPLKTIVDLAQGKLKLCKSLDKLWAQVADDIKVHQEKRKRALQKQARATKLQAEIDAANEALEEEKAAAAAAKARKLQLTSTDTTTGTATKPRATRNSAKVMAGLDTTISEVDEAIKASTQAMNDNRARKKTLEKEKRQVENEPAADPQPKKRTKKNDVIQLVKTSTPREKAAAGEGDTWKPPTYNSEKGKAITYSDPGESWKTENVRKWRLLKELRNHLKTAGLCKQPMSFLVLLDFVGGGKDAENLGFNDRVWLYLCALVLAQKR